MEQTLISKYLKISSNPGSYWNGRGDYQEEYDYLDSKIPVSGKASNPYLELIRCVSNIYYNCYNDGWRNNKEYEINYLIKNKSKYMYEYKGKKNIDSLLSDIKKIQTMLKNSDFTLVKEFSKKEIEPDLDNLCDSIIRVAFENKL